jgi:hypothetical protein
MICLNMITPCVCRRLCMLMRDLYGRGSIKLACHPVLQCHLKAMHVQVFIELIGPRGTTGPLQLPKVRRSFRAGRAAGQILCARSIKCGASAASEHLQVAGLRCTAVWPASCSVRTASWQDDSRA